ncbi:hypothetical protein [Sphingosinicella sp.]|uniref:hypothetical protein n=1 Tax=Sphingosinicella sp. TaxID=1917971 RepID=UPI0025D75A4C|nr:hypothetical protein [Sphingosinicella sp.]
MTKSELIAEILQELRKAQAAKWKSPPAGPVEKISFPPSLWLGDGRSLAVTEALLNTVSAYTRICWSNAPELKPRFKIDELNKLAAQSFGLALAEIDLDLNDAQLLPLVSERVEELLAEQINRHNRPIDLTLGCHLVEGDEPYPLQIGPVVFETREVWRQRMLAAGKLSPTTARRLRARWNGKLPRKRKRSVDSSAEESILDSIGECPVVCIVATDGLSGRYIQEKGLLAARLAMTAISLAWHQPSEGLRWMKLLYDRRRPHRYTVLFGRGTNVGANSECTEFPVGRYSEPALLENLHSYCWLFDQVGEALNSYVRPNQPVARPKAMNALFLSLWWYHEACQEPLDQIATTKFAASMDALTGGKKASGIIELIGALLGPKPADLLMKDDRTTKAVIAEIYDAGRSRLIHGSSTDYAHDWTQVRASAEEIGRWLLIACCDWLLQNPQRKDLKDLGPKYVSATERAAGS